MSTKIWCAARVPHANYHEFMTWVKESTRPKALEVVKGVMSAFKEEPKDEWDRFDKVVKALRAVDDNNNPFFLPTPSLWVQVYMDSEWVYCIFVGGNTPDTDNLPAYAEEYHYQNSTDGPDWSQDDPEGAVYEDKSTWGPGHLKWRARSDKWDELLLKYPPMTVCTIWGYDTDRGAKDAVWDLMAKANIGIFAKSVVL